MGLDKSIREATSDITHQEWTISMHSFSSLTHVSPVVFLYLLKECYIHGKCTSKFDSLRQTVHQVLYNAPRPGPAVFVARCLSVLPIFGLYCEVLSRLIVSALRRLLKTGTTQEDLLGAKSLAAQLFLNSVGGNGHDERVLIKILEVFDIRLENIEKVLCKLDVKNGNDLNTAKTFVEQYVYELIESQSYKTAVTLLERFSFSNSGESFLFKMMENKEYSAAEKWADFMGRPMLCALVQQYSDKLLLESAYDVIKKHNLKNEFPEVYHKGKECSLKKLAEKGLWDIAEARTNNDKQLLEYLVYLAMEAGYLEKVEELCDRYSLKGFANEKEHQASFQHNRFLSPNKLALENIIWVDEVTGLHDAICQIERCKVVGIDCEWKPVYEKCKQPKVSIMQIASEKMVHIFDLIKLFQDVPDILDEYLTRIFHSSTILKLGYDFQCDGKQLAHSYGDLMCFKHYNMLLDIQNLFNEPRGGLSGLAKKILGAELNKTRRNSNWEQRPLTPNQLEYAALDAAVLIHIFSHVQGHSPSAGLSNEHTKIEWKSHIVRHMGKPIKNIQQLDVGADEPSELSWISHPPLVVVSPPSVVVAAPPSSSVVADAAVSPPLAAVTGLTGEEIPLILSSIPFPTIDLDEPLLMSLIEESVILGAEGVGTEKKKTLEGGSSSDPQFASKRQRVTIGGSEQGISIDATCFPASREFLVEAFESFRCPADEPRYEGVNLQTLVEMQLQNQAQGNATLLRLAKHCEEVERQLALAKVESVEAKLLAHKRLELYRNSFHALKDVERERKVALEDKTKAEAALEEAEAKRIKAEADFADADAKRKSTKAALQKAEIEKIEAEEKMHDAQAEKFEVTQLAMGLTNKLEVEEKKREMLMEDLQRYDATSHTQTEQLQNLKTNIQKVVEDWSARETEWTRTPFALVSPSHILPYMRPRIIAEYKTSEEYTDEVNQRVANEFSEDFEFAKQMVREKRHSPKELEIVLPEE